MAAIIEFNITDELKKLPKKPGVYLMHGPDDEILYVGKAVNLYNRVHQYFQNPEGKSATIRKMITLIRRFEYIVVGSELEALVLENNLIKENRPKYNTLLKDDKTYPFIRATIDEPYPRIFMTRKFRNDRSRYFGPYTSVNAVRDVLNLLHKIYRIRTCSLDLPKETGKNRPCLNHSIGQCMAPCSGLVSEEEYLDHFQKALDFLSGKFEPVTDFLKKKMQTAAEGLQFEDAAEYRDLLQAVEELRDRQKVTSTSDENDRDVIGLAFSDKGVVIQVFFIRRGVMIGRESFRMDPGEEEMEESILVSSFVNRFYTGTPYIPQEILLQCEISDEDLIRQWLQEAAGHKCRILVPKIGQHRKLVEMAIENAGIVLNQDCERLKREALKTLGANTALKDLLGLDQLHRIESYDISNTSGFDPVGSMVVFQNGKALKSDYRKFRIRGVDGPNDIACMKEVLSRRFSHSNDQEDRFGQYPDLILMDGGIAQVNICEEVIREKGLYIPVAGMVKDDHHRTRGLLYQGNELPLDPHKEPFLFLTRIQDETHRFAIEYHKSLRSKKQVHSVLDDIAGIGPKRKLSLLHAYPSMELLSSASCEQLEKLPGMDRKAAQSVYEFLHLQSGQT